VVRGVDDLAEEQPPARPALPVGLLCSTIEATKVGRWGAKEGVPSMGYEVINLLEKARLLAESWQPRVVAELNDYQLKVVRVEGDFLWHDHPDTDEAFVVLEGSLRIDLPEGSVHLGAGDLYVVPRGVQHKPYAEAETLVLVIEPRGVSNTGSAGGERTAPQDIWI
jgi:mannose-6-phosphate isomerase-like protein (cupin superfamily)